MHSGNLFPTFEINSNRMSYLLLIVGIILHMGLSTFIADKIANFLDEPRHSWRRGVSVLTYSDWSFQTSTK